MTSNMKTFSTNEVSLHNSADDAWIIINGVIWDMSGFAPMHPGGEDVIQEHFGKDASKSYNGIHSPGLVSNYLKQAKAIGVVEASPPSAPVVIETTSEAGNPKLAAAPPELDTILNLYDLEKAAQQSLPERAWHYFSGASNDCCTAAWNIDFYRYILLRPRVLKSVAHCDMSTTVMGQTFQVPIFNSPASLAMLSHPKAEVALAQGLAACGSTIIIPTLASYSAEEIVESLPKDYPFFFQLYVPRSMSARKNILDTVKQLKPAAIIITADLPVMSKREANERYETRVAKAKEVSSQPSNVQKRQSQGRTQARAAGAAIESDLTWQDIRQIREITGLPIFIKGIQCVEDAIRAMQIGCSGIYVSNHGGRAADTAQPSILTLAEIRMRCPEVFERMDVLVDGGIRRGSDILKAICLGAKGVCLGRMFFYALIYGQEGVEHTINSKCGQRGCQTLQRFSQTLLTLFSSVSKVLRDELETSMQLCGIKSLSEAHPGLLNTKFLNSLIEHGYSYPMLARVSESKL
ncbi:L-lactate dehydrogenase (cytochrome) [Exophiala dermatitidis]